MQSCDAILEDGGQLLQLGQTVHCSLAAALQAIPAPRTLDLVGCGTFLAQVSKALSRVIHLVNEGTEEEAYVARRVAFVRELHGVEPRW